MSSISRFNSAVAILFKVMFPVKLLRWLICFSLVSIVLVQVLAPVVWWSGALMFATIILSIFVSFVIIPFQVIALATSRPIMLLGDSRRWLLLTLVLIGFLFSLALYKSIYALPKATFSISLLVIWLMVSILLQLSILICSRWPGIHGFIFMLNMTFSHIAVWLGERHPVELLAAVIVSWGLFGYWWLHWLPGKYQKSKMFLPAVEQQKHQAESLLGSHMMTGRAHSWIGSRLFGAPDGWLVRGKRMLGSLAILIMFSLPIIFVMERESFIQIIHFGVVVFLLVMAGAVSQGIASGFFRNLRNIWLCTSGDRSALFPILWRCYWRESAPWALLLIAIAVSLEIIFDAWRGIETWLLLTLSVVLIQTVVFYLVWFIYQKTAASFLWCNWVCGLVFLVWIYSICATGLLFQLPFNWQGISTLWIWLPEILVIAALHNKVRAGFCKMDLLRVV